MGEIKGQANRITGKKVLSVLAETYRQLYLDPTREGAGECYLEIVRKGLDAPAKSLSHFQTSDGDTLETVQTPAGAVQIVTLIQRSDFECFLQIMANRCERKEISKTQGASILDGVINWRKIDAHKEIFFAQARERGDVSPDWGEEFRHFTAEKQNYTDALIVLSVGPYSGVSPEDAGLPEADWLSASQIIRKTHECTHFICRRQFPEKIDPLWDELVADAVGILMAFSHYDRRIAECVLGIKDGSYTGGRLEIYLDKAEHSASFLSSAYAAPFSSAGDRSGQLQAVTQWALATLDQIEKLLSSQTHADPYAWIPVLQSHYPG